MSLSYAILNNTAFHIFENATTKQVVFAFRGSTAISLSTFNSYGLTNWAADLTQSDGGFSSYQGIGPKAQEAFDLMATDPGSPWTGSAYLADGHSLGGSIAQTFAVLNGLNGFSQNTLPISPGEVSAITGEFGASAITDYQNAFSFQNAELQGDVAAANYAGGTFAFKNTAIWLYSPYGVAETQLIKDLSAHWYSKYYQAGMRIGNSNHPSRPSLPITDARNRY